MGGGEEKPRFQKPRFLDQNVLPEVTVCMYRAALGCTYVYLSREREKVKG